MSNINITDIFTKFNIKKATRRGNEINFCCPFHDDMSPSASMNVDTKLFKCFGCGAKGNIIHFISRLSGKDYKAVLEEYGSEDSDEDYNESLERIRKVVNKEDDIKCDLSIYKEFFKLMPMITQVKSNELDYLINERGLTRETLDKHGVKFILRDKLASFVKKYSEKELKDSKLFKENKSFISYNHNILFPLFVDNNIVGFQLRTIDSSKMRYLNINKVIFYNANEIINSNEIIICEGVIDCLTLQQIGKSAIGLLGAMSFSPEWVCYFMNKDVTILLDNDEAGKRASLKIKEILEENDIVPKLRKINSKYGDINEWYVKEKLKH